MTTLVIGAHPDDEVLSPGGTIARLARERGESVYVLIVTDGSSTQYPGDLEKREQKDQELARCCEILGVKDYAHGDLPDMQLETVPHTEITALISKYVSLWKPEAVYTHFPDINRDHERVYESTLVAARSLPGSSIRKLALYPTHSAAEWSLPGKGHSFTANEWVDVTQTIETKLEALRCYRTELRDPPHPRSLEAVRSFAASAGSMAGVAYAEQFMVIRSQW